MSNKYDFSGWATKNDMLCSDGRTIRQDAFKHNDGQTVPLVWNHQHNDPSNILGGALLENRDQGVYVYGTFNSTDAGVTAKELVEHGDITGLSIYANKLQQKGGNVLHGDIKEVSLVLAGANPGAFIDSVVMHSDGSSAESETEAIIFTGENLLVHAEDATAVVEKKVEPKQEVKVVKEKVKKEETVQEVFDSLTDKEKDVVYGMRGFLDRLDDKKKQVVYSLLVSDDTKKVSDELKEVVAAEDNKESIKQSELNDEPEEEEVMKHNIFEQEDKDTSNVISHSEQEAIIADARRFGSLKESALQHGVTDIDFLFPDAQSATPTPEFIKRDTGWVSKVVGAARKTPFSRVKSVFADITLDDARAFGYIKGNLKKDEVFSLLKRTTSPQTIYKKQKLDRDDLVDITDFDIVAWIKSEMRGQLEEELARAILVGDGRLASSDDKIKEDNIRPIWTDADLYTIKKAVEIKATDTPDVVAKAIIRAALKARKDYKGSGNPTLFTTEDYLTDMLLMEDAQGRMIYDSVAKLATVLRVKEIVTVPVMENLTRDVSGTAHGLIGVIVNMQDYNIGADKGGAINLFDDFDIDYNAYKYLIETRCSGALIRPYSAIALEKVVTA